MAKINKKTIPEEAKNKKISAKEKGNEKTAKRELSVNGYTIIPILQNTKNPEIRSYIYVKQHSNGNMAGEMNFPENRTLFVYNLPVYSTKKDVEMVFRKLAGVKVVEVFFNGIIGVDGINNEGEKWKILENLKAKEKEAANASGKRRRGKRDAGKNKTEGGVDSKGIQRIESGSTAHVVLAKTEDIEKVLCSVMDEKRIPVVWRAEDGKDVEEYRGIQRYKFEYQKIRPELDTVQKEVDLFMQKFEAAEYEREKAISAQRNVPDEDGFVTVSYSNKNRKGAFDSMGGANADISMVTGSSMTVTGNKALSEKLAAKKKKMEHATFYRWQQRENKKQEINDLRKKFEDDKAKIEQLKAKRRFKPY
ncbi:Ribosomal RNA-processing protein-like protein [Zancudomyces culisetae]|uniref:Ribosomal RNA-processing protein-like protein n=1 Tax=Zancudomyces culisetae TaxID=1213189 RepID=A0A1R1PUP5_ZANCU|nr:Ribosomal RNA-processing protein-like protein [Zancudomyces culisetae]OMH84698.1 Ribosomal RNA-processing protein-like protein [Zancudomyces culisetae]|eukprot:OMH82985.1 Ribosomal RNA-processing protein-like protein [Zancudomyces culisetae]